MKTKLLLFTFFIAAISFGQDNPVENLTWSQSYEYPNNYFELRWEEPAQPHNEIMGYNIYRNNELYQFHTETSLYNLYTQIYGFVSNCSADFLIYGDGSGFDIHVTAVYNSAQMESNYLQTVHSYGAALNTKNFSQEKAIVYPNPTNGIVNIGNENLTKIVVYDISGKKIKESEPNFQIDLSDISKGIYFIKLISDKGIMIDKIIIE